MFMPVLAVIYGGINALKNKLALLSGILCIGLVIAFIFYTGRITRKKGVYDDRICHGNCSYGIGLFGSGQTGCGCSDRLRKQTGACTDLMADRRLRGIPCES